MEPATIAEFEEMARKVIPQVTFPGLFDGLEHPVERANRNNVQAFGRLSLRPRVLVDVSRRDLSTSVLGQSIDLPVMLAPVSGHAGFHGEGELASVRAAGAAGTILVLGMLSSYSLEEVAEAASGPIWFQLYVLQDRLVVENVVRRADQAGYSALVITVDNKTFRFPGVTGPYAAGRTEPAYANFTNLGNLVPPTPDRWWASKSRSFEWSDLEWIRSLTDMPIVIKGIQTGEDANRCVQVGIDALIVSNHGGFALYGAEGTASTLPEVVDAVGGKIDVFLDGGVRHGTDVLKALALGAKAVLIGRAMIWGLATYGEPGVGRILEILRDELDDAMGMCGVTTVSSVDRRLVRESTAL